MLSEASKMKDSSFSPEVEVATRYRQQGRRILEAARGREAARLRASFVIVVAFDDFAARYKYSCTYVDISTKRIWKLSERENTFFDLLTNDLG